MGNNSTLHRSLGAQSRENWIFIYFWNLRGGGLPQCPVTKRKATGDLRVALQWLPAIVLSPLPFHPHCSNTEGFLCVVGGTAVGCVWSGMPEVLCRVELNLDIFPDYIITRGVLWLTEQDCY